MNTEILEKALNHVNSLLGHLDKHYYHHFDHALDVMNRAIYLGEKEGISNEDKEVLALASIFHDTGFIVHYDDNETIGAKIAKNYLKSIGYDNDKIILIEKLIISTSPKYKKPKNILEKIIKDADLDNFGREDFFEKGNNLKKEIEMIKEIKIKDPEWHHSSLDLLYEHKYHTKTQIKERGSKKEENRKKLKSIIKNVDGEKSLDLGNFL